MCRGEKQPESKSLASADEGFEDAKSGDFAKSSPRVSQINLVNAEKSRPKKIIEEPTKKTLTRGQILMNMIKLDTVEFSLYEAHPISYDEYIRTYGKLNSQQTFTQTNEDNLDVEIQTTGIELENKWTQFPVRCRGSLKTHDDVRQFKLDHLGCGGDAPDQSSFFAAPSYDVLGLTEFLDRAGKLVLALLEEREMGGDVLGSDTRDFPFSEGCVKLATCSISFLAGRQVRRLCYAESNHKILASVHASSHEKFRLTDKQDYIKDCCVGCVWNINEPSRPTKMFYSPSPVTTCCFHCTNNNIVFAVSAWSLQLNLPVGSARRRDLASANQRQDQRDGLDSAQRDLHDGGKRRIVALEHGGGHRHAAQHRESRQRSGREQQQRRILQHSAVQPRRGRPTDRLERHKESDAATAAATKRRQQQRQRSRPGPVGSRETRQEPGGGHEAARGRRRGQVLRRHGRGPGGQQQSLSGRQRHQRAVRQLRRWREKQHSVLQDQRDGFLRKHDVPRRCKDGSIRLHSLHAETPLMKLKDEDSLAGIRTIQWSRSRPTIFYVLDDQSRIAVWDMLKSATKPIHVVATTNWESVKCIKLSPCNVERDKQNQYMAIGTYGGNVEVHKLKRDFYFSKQEDMQREMDAFLEFVSIL
uniref:WD repeat-containing protein 60 n=1 Tax=Trichogramma kaykai TaxID=54128 RepID=A0ABD2X9J0_9HYME